MKATAWTSVLLFLLSTMYIRTTAQPWQYTFGSTVDSCSAGVSTLFLPVPPAGSGRIRIGSQGGSVALVSPGYSTLGSGSELHLQAPTGGSLNKVQVHGIPQTSAFTIRLSFRIDGGAGTFYFFTGNGSCFQNNSGFSSSEVFAGLRWVLDSTGAVTTALRLPSGWSTLPAGTSRSDTVHTLELYCNNRSSVVSYAHDSSCVLAARSLDLWIDGHRVAHDRVKTGLPDTTTISAFMFYAAYSPGNGACLSIDDIDYTNDIASVPLPVELSSFTLHTVDGHPQLRWTTETELNNHGFSIERRSRNASDWQEVGFVAGRGSTQTPQRYFWTDSATIAGGSRCYRLRQIDRDGSSTVSDECCLEERNRSDDIQLGVPWPQPARDVIHLPIDEGSQETVSVRIITLTGVTVAVLPKRCLLPADGSVLTLPCATWPRGILLCILEKRTSMSVIPFVLL